VKGWACGRGTVNEGDMVDENHILT
jgi:hypothetical protein